MKIRARHCSDCEHLWASPVELSKNTTNLSGEATAFCPQCGSKNVCSGPEQSVLQMIAPGAAAAIVLNPDQYLTMVSLLESASQAFAKPTPGSLDVILEQVRESHDSVCAKISTDELLEMLFGWFIHNFDEPEQDRIQEKLKELVDTVNIVKDQGELLVSEYDFQKQLWYVFNRLGRRDALLQLNAAWEEWTAQHPLPTGS